MKGISQPTVRRYLDVLTQAFMVRQLQPWHANMTKRQVKAPKVYFRDVGLLHALMGIRTLEELLNHPHSGASWEGFALEQVLRLAQPDEAWFWATHQDAELELLLLRGRQRVGVEFKRADAPRVTPSMRIAMTELQLDALYVVYPGLHRYPLEAGMEAVPLGHLLPQSWVFPQAQAAGGTLAPCLSAAAGSPTWTWTPSMRRWSCCATRS